MTVLKSPEEFTEFAAQLHDGLEDGIQFHNQGGIVQRFYFGSGDSGSIETRLLDSDRTSSVSMTHFTELYVGGIRNFVGDKASAYGYTETTVLAAALIAHRHNTLADRAYSMAVVMRQQAPSYIGNVSSNPYPYEEYAAQSVRHRVDAERAEGSFQALYAGLAHISNIPRPQGATA